MAATLLRELSPARGLTVTSSASESPPIFRIARPQAIMDVDQY